MRPFQPDQPAKPARPRKPKPSARPRESLPADPPKEIHLSKPAKAVYRQLAERLQAEGFAALVDARAVALAARQWVFVDRLEAEVQALPSLSVDGMKGGIRVHPLVVELRAAQGRLQSLLGCLMMTPRSRSSSRLSKDWRAAGETSDPFDDFIKSRDG